MLWSLLATALAADALWVLEPEQVTTSAPVTLKSPKELEVSRPSLDCGVVVTLLATGDHDYLPTTSCADPKLFTALKEAAQQVTYTWSTPDPETPDAVVLLGVMWPADETQPITLVPRRAVTGSFNPPAKYVGAAKKLAPDQKRCVMDIHILRAGAAKVERFIECDPLIQKAIAPAFDVWSWKVGPEVPRRALHQILRVDFFDSVPVAGKSKPMALVSGLGPRLDPKHEQPELPEGVSKEAKAKTTCWLDVQVSAAGQATGASAVDCHADLVSAATEAAKGWAYLPANQDGALVDSHLWVKVEFTTE